MWENLLANPDYTTDTGDAQKGDIYSRGYKILGNQSGPDAISLEEAFARMGRLQGGPMLLIKTSKYGRNPGAFYAKAFVSKGADWDSLVQVLKDNQLSGFNSTRKAWVCGPGRKWN
jgi:hypothetical protein